MDTRHYEVRVAGFVATDDLLREVGDLDSAVHEVRTVLTGRFPDQAALHGLLHRLRAYGLDVVEVRRLAEVDPAPRAPEGPS
jgi:hypothetical protein